MSTPDTAGADTQAQTQTQTLALALERLVARGTLTRQQAAAVLAELSGQSLPAARGRGWTAALAETGGYLGATFVVAAVLVFTGPRWNDLGEAARLAVFAIPAVAVLLAAAALAAAAPGRWSPYPRPGLGPRRRLVATLIVAGGGLLAATVSTALGPPDNGAQEGRQATLTALTALIVWVAGYLTCRIALLHLAMAGAACATMVSAISWIGDGTSSGAAWAGGGIVAVAVLWAGLCAGGVLREKALGYPTAGVIAFVGAEIIGFGGDSTRWMGYLVLALLAAAGLTGYLRTRLIPVLVVGVIALATVVPQAIIDYTEGSLGAAGGLLVVGLSIVGASVLGLRLHREVPGRHGHEQGADGVTSG